MKTEPRNVWILTQSFPPLSNIAAKRYGGLVGHLEALGWKPWIITVLEHKSAEGRALGELSVPLEKRQIIKLDQRRLARRFIPTRAFRFLLFQLREFLRRKGWDLCSFDYLDDDFERCSGKLVARDCREAGFPKPDAIISSVSPGGSILLGRYLAKFHNAKWLVDFRDLNALREGRPRLQRKLDQFLERKFVGPAVGFLAVSPTHAEILSTAYGRPVSVVFNGYDQEILDLTEEADGSRPPYLYYAGRLYKHQLAAAKLLIEAVATANKRENTDLIVVFRTLRPRVVYSVLESYLAARGLSNLVSFLPEASSHQVLKEAQGSVANVVLESLETEFYSDKGVLTGKLLELLNLKPPILALARPDSDIGDVLSSCSAGFHCADLQSVVVRVEEVLGKPQPKKHIGLYSRAQQAKRIAKFLDLMTAQ